MNRFQLLVTCTFATAAAIVASPSPAEIRFSDVTSQAGVDHPGSHDTDDDDGRGESWGASWGDLDGDGRPDLFVTNHRQMTSLFLNKGDGTFLDVASQTFSWLNQPRAAIHGGSWFDFDNDGDQDLLVTTGIGNSSQFLVNERGALIDRARRFGIDSVSWGGRLPVWMDYNGDGRPDFVMMMIGEPAQVMRQVQGGFLATDVGLECERQQYGQLIDVNADGRLDLICPDDPSGTNPTYPLAAWDTLPVPWDSSVGAAFPAGDDAPGAGPDSVIADFDNDGNMDIFLLGDAELRPSGAELSAAGDRIEARLMGDSKGFSFAASGTVEMSLHSNIFEERLALIEGGDAQAGHEFEWIRLGAAENTPSATRFTLDPVAMVDEPAPIADQQRPILDIWYDEGAGRWNVRMHSRRQSGEAAWSDVYFEITSTGAMSDLETTDLWPTDGPARPTLLMNRSGAFVDETEQWGLDDPVQCVSVTAGDFNNDTRVDLYLACRTATGNIENILLENQAAATFGDGTFVRIADAGGATGPEGMAVADGAGTADTVVSADYDGDGFLDLFVTNGFNMYPRNQGGPNRLFRNVSANGNHWIQLDLVGTDSHREALGARVVAATADGEQTRVKDGRYHRWSHDHARIHFGLATAETVDLTIHWPSGIEETHTDVEANAIYRAIEGGGIEVVNHDEALPYPCGLPKELVELGGDALNDAVGRGLFLGQNCASGTWQMRATRGPADGTTPVFSGRIVSSSPFESVRLRNLQGPDTVLCDGEECTADETAANGDPVITSGVTELSYELRLFGGFRGIDFTPEDGANTCMTVEVTPPAGTRIAMGPLQKVIPESATSEFYIDTLEPCPGGNPETPPPQDDTGPIDDGDGGVDGDDGSGNGNGNGNGNGGDDDTEAQEESGGGGGGSLGVAWFAALALLAARRRSGRLACSRS